MGVCYNINVLGADGYEIGSGNQNTLDIVDNLCLTEDGGISAAESALNFEVNGYSDWPLPSYGELEQLLILFIARIVLKISHLTCYIGRQQKTHLIVLGDLNQLLRVMLQCFMNIKILTDIMPIRSF